MENIIFIKGIKKVISVEAVRGFPNLKIEEGIIYGDFQIGNQKKTSHKKLQHLATLKVLELLYMDLMGPMQVESLGGNRYIFVCVNDFSRYTWVNLIREKYDTFDVFKELCLRMQKEKGSEIVNIRSDHDK